MVAKNTKKTPQDKASKQPEPVTKRAPSKKPTTTTPIKPTKPPLSKHPKSPTKKHSKLDEAQQEYVAQGESDDPALELAKKMSLDAHQEKGEGKGADADIERAIKLSWDPSFLPQGQAHVGGVAIRDPVSETIPKLPEVVGKVLRDQTPHDSTTGPSSQPKDDTSEKVVHKSSSTTDSERTESGTEAAAPKGDKEQGEVASSTMTSGVGISIRTEDQAGSDPGKAHEALAGLDPESMQEDQTGSDSGKVHVSLAGPNPEHTDEEFLATAYPKIDHLAGQEDILSDIRVFYDTLTQIEWEYLIAGARETVGSPVVQQNGIQCFNCKGFGHYARECRKPKRVKDYAYHKEKMMMCKQAEQGVPLQAEQADWLEDTDEEIDEQELEAHYSYMAKIQEVSPAESSSTDTPLEQVQNHDENDVFANVRRHSEQPESINDTYVLEKDDSNVIPDSSNICTNDNQVDQNAAECVDERAALANLIANLTLDTEENKTILKQLKKANASLTQELKECKTNLDESSRALGEATSSRDSSLIALQTKQTELEKYTALNDLTSDYKILQTKLNETLGLLARKDIDIKEGLKTKTYEISVVNQKHDELVKKSLLTRSQFEGQLKEKTKVISDLKVKEGKDIDTMIEMDKQIKFLNEILYKRNQSIQTIHMLAPKCATYHGRSTFANPKYLKKAQSEKPRLYEIPYDTSDPANRFCPNGEETVTLEKESRSKLDKDKVKPYNYTYQNSLYETFKPPSKTYLDQLERAKEVRKTMWRKTHCFVHELKKEMNDDLEYVNSLEKELDELESEKADFSNIYDLLLEECVNLPQIRKQAVRNTNVIAPGPSRNFPKHVSHQSPREKVGSNDMLEEAKKVQQLQKDKEVNGKT
ncbi:integrase, catalytic region, zinc finger, CCHC-type containing protein [Tanacetum coccineum]